MTHAARNMKLMLIPMKICLAQTAEGTGRPVEMANHAERALIVEGEQNNFLFLLINFLIRCIMI